MSFYVDYPDFFDHDNDLSVNDAKIIRDTNDAIN